jgi:hypothetical protein
VVLGRLLPFFAALLLWLRFILSVVSVRWCQVVMPTHLYQVCVHVAAGLVSVDGIDAAMGTQADGCWMVRSIEVL